MLKIAEADFGEKYPLRFEVRETEHEMQVFAMVDHKPSLAHSALLGDVVCNLRSALDLAVIAACQNRGETSPKKLSKTYFAFGGDEKDWDCNAHRRMLAADSEIRAVVKSFQPWKVDGYFNLYSLSKLAASDKHRSLIPINRSPTDFTEASLKVTTFRPNTKLRARIPQWGEGNEALFFVAAAPSQIKITGPSIVPSKFGFGSIDGLEGQPVIQMLSGIHGIVSYAVEKLERLPTN